MMEMVSGKMPIRLTVLLPAKVDRAETEIIRALLVEMAEIPCPPRAERLVNQHQRL